MRLGLVARTATADLDTALADLGRWPGATAIVRLDLSLGPPDLHLELDPEALATYGFGPADVTARLAPVVSEDGAAELTWAGEDTVEGLARLPLVHSSGLVVPLGAVARIRQVAAPDPVVHVDGREARLVDVLLADGQRLEDWRPPTDIEVVRLDGLGPGGLGLLPR